MFRQFLLYYQHSILVYVYRKEVGQMTSLLFMLCSLLVYEATKRYRITISRTSVGNSMNRDLCSAGMTAGFSLQSATLISLHKN